jgi:peptidyl-prolyl cis-trans isomerase D
MMSTLRENAKFILWFVIGAFILTIVAVWGLKGQVFKQDDNPDIVAKINKDTLTYTELGEAWRNKLQDLYDKGVKVSEEREKELKKELLYDMIETRLKLDYAKKLGIITSDDEVAENIMSIPAFNTKDGQFDKQQYLRFLNSQNIQSDEFEDQQRRYITLVKLRNQLWSQIRFSMDELRTYFVKRQRSIKADYVYFNYKNYLSQLNISDDKLKDYYAMHRKDYEKPERVKASHILIVADASPTSPTGLTEEAALKLASALTAKIKSGANFAELAKKYSADPGSREKGGELGWFGKNSMVAEFEKAAFALPRGGISDPVKTQYGYHIIKVEDKDAGFSPTFDKVKDQVLKAVQKQEGMEIMQKKSGKFSAEVKTPDDFSRAAAGNTVTVRSLGYFTEDSRTAEIESTKFKDQLFDMNTGSVSKVIDGDNGYYVFRITGELPAKFDGEKFNKKQADLVEKLRNIKFDQIMSDLLTQLKREAKIEVFEKNL